VKYLLYYVTKQTAPWFARDLRPHWLADCDNGDLVIVDVPGLMRCVGGVWEPCDVDGVPA
jgi:hypothetical protein